MRHYGPAERSLSAFAPFYSRGVIVYHIGMLFRRRKPATLSQRIRALVWPRKGLLRGWRYLSMRVLRLSSSPHSIALGVAAGAASSATPFIGFHILIAIAIAYLLSGNLLAAGISTALANPLTIPFILAAIYEAGTAMLGTASGELKGEQILGMLASLQISELWAPLMKPMLVGCLPIAAASAVVFYLAAFVAAKLFQSRRVSRRLARMQAHIRHD